MLEVRAEETASIARRLQSGLDVDSDLVLRFSPDFIAEVVSLYEGRRGSLDASTHYTIKGSSVELHYGSAIAHLLLNVAQEGYGLRLSLRLDCVLNFRLEGENLRIGFEPYNIVPVVESEGWLIGSEDLVNDIVRTKLATLSDDFPPIEVPLLQSQSVEIDGTNATIAGDVNMRISTPRRLLNYSFILKELLVLPKQIIVAVDLADVEVK
ncbi:MAG: hypothetical protein CL946_07535 [Ectothiorhodospiraceae bacterium]|nr:hypothetical protein [Ectothiorhodospiraceae bacterium]